MSTATTKKRLENIEENLTPKEWAIRFADERRKNPSTDAFLRAHIDSGLRTIDRAHEKLVQQAEARHPGRNSTAALRADIKRTQVEFSTLKYLLFKVNVAVETRVELGRTEVNLKVQALELMCLRDMFGSTASKVAQWIANQARIQRAEDGTYQPLLNELATYTQVGEGGGFCSMATPWVNAMQGLALDLLNHKAAVVMIQNAYFGGHSVLSLDTEARLDTITNTVREIADHYNLYLTLRSEPVSGHRIDVDGLSMPAWLPERLADMWLASARDDAVLEVLGCMGEVSAQIAHSRDMVKRMLGPESWPES
jgi:hypothetical protein